jgi:membrane-anchored protein YejM (alkaline phosphatase superfamily)
MTKTPGDRPNVLLITADQWRGDSLSVLGHACARTPNLDALARDGVAFTRHFGHVRQGGVIFWLPRGHDQAAFEVMGRMGSISSLSM